MKTNALGKLNKKGIGFKNRKTTGFTLMEMLIVVAIIAILVAIAIPVINKQLEKTKEATDLANIRNAYAQVSVKLLDGSKDNLLEVVDLMQSTNGWITPTAAATLKKLVGNGNVIGTPQEKGKATVYWENNQKYILFEGPLPVSLSVEDLTNQGVLNEKYGLIVEALWKTAPIIRETAHNQGRYDYYGDGDTNDEKVMIYTYQTGDGQTIAKVKQAMKDAGYNDNEINAVYGSLRYAYYDKDGKLLGFHGPSSGGKCMLYTPDSTTPVPVQGSVAACNYLAKKIQQDN